MVPRIVAMGPFGWSISLRYSRQLLNFPIGLTAPAEWKMGELRSESAQSIGPNLCIDVTLISSEEVHFQIVLPRHQLSYTPGTMCREQYHHWLNMSEYRRWLYARNIKVNCTPLGKLYPKLWLKSYSGHDLQTKVMTGIWISSLLRYFDHDVSSECKYMHKTCMTDLLSWLLWQSIYAEVTLVLRITRTGWGHEVSSGDTFSSRRANRQDGSGIPRYSWFPFPHCCLVSPCSRHWIKRLVLIDSGYLVTSVLDRDACMYTASEF